MSRTRANAQGGMMRNLNSAPTPELEDYLSSNRVRAQSTKATGGYVRKTMHNNDRNQAPSETSAKEQSSRSQFKLRNPFKRAEASKNSKPK
ncbi:hypothetical protein Moror_10957 [Moniliophthora roreri MCA 2997]|uniref:Uncharacterized protein n=1 Tax=Moniliophthora roreri (strain MCA 2997) TaxID=1381753 RepID=V2Y499_MONRO|nr:hypothetical protein Moror_10957 [Moniliophthora roreri MCA 2997]KAI3603263.1 hypothetical protein WG66_002318 [Moniliophthora roreri]